MAAPLNPKIQDLVTRLNRDPDSKIFLQLAEEYRKAGFLEEALLVCKGGLKKHPGYHSARVALGRIYLALNRLEEARAEFEAIVRTAPDNLLANRMLGDVLALVGDVPAALQRYRAVVAYGPADAEVRAKVEALERGEDPRQVGRWGNVPGAAPGSPAAAAAPAQRAASASAPAARPAAPPPAKSVPRAEGPSPPRPAPEAQAPPPPRAAVAAAPGPTRPPAATHRTETIRPQAAAPRDEAPAAAARAPRGETEAARTLAIRRPSSSSEEEEVATDLTSSGVRGSGGGSVSTQTLAELYVRQGFIDRAVDVYRRMLVNDPGNAEFHKRLVELTAMVPAPEPEMEVAGMRAAQAVEDGEPTDAPPVAPSGDEPPADRQAAIQRLERWLHAVQDGREPG